MQIVDEIFLELGLYHDKKLSSNQLKLLDISNEQFLSGDYCGKTLSDARAELFVLLNGIHDDELEEHIIKNYKSLQKYRKELLNQVKQEVIKEIKEEVGDVIIYCDGGCSPNPGKSGSGVAIYKNEKIFELWYGLYEEDGTNNTAELGALYQSLLIAQKENEAGNSAEIRCDSMYSINCIKTWGISWEKKNWTKKGGEIKNLEIIKQCFYLYHDIKNNVQLNHVKAHAGEEGNELADRMTQHARMKKDTGFVKYHDKINIVEILKS